MCTKYLLMLCVLAFVAEAQVKLFNVRDYGAVADGKKDNNATFLKAWSDACSWNGTGTVLIPEGTFMLTSVIFNGLCKGWTTFQVNGVLKAPSDQTLLTDQKWMNFRSINQLTVNGGGTLNGQGASTRQICGNNTNCQILFTENSHVQIRNMTYKNIRGSSATDFGVSFNCRQVMPCQHITLEDINLSRYGGGNLSNFCSHVHGASYGQQIPPSCIPHSTTPLWNVSFLAYVWFTFILRFVSIIVICLIFLKIPLHS